MSGHFIHNAIERPRVRRAATGLILAQGAPLGWLFIVAITGGDPADEIVNQPGVYIYMLVGTSIVFTLFGLFVGDREEHAILLGIRDHLTGLFNVRYFRERLREACAGLDRDDGNSVALIMFDLDFFKRVNDSFGHEFGDEVLRRVAEVMHAEQRGEETLARVGGEEFALLVPNATADEAIGAANRILARVREIRFQYKFEDPFWVTLSAGVSVAAPPVNAKAAADGLYAAADRALYAAKDAGRNRAVCMPLEG